MGSLRPFWSSWPLCCGVLHECSQAHCSLPALWSPLLLENDWRCGLWEANLIGTLPHTLIQINCCQPWARVGASLAKMNKSNKSTWKERNRWGLFFINGVGVKLAGWTHVATPRFECLLNLGRVYRLRDDLVYSSEKTQWSSINVTNLPHKQFNRFCIDLSGGRGLWIGV